ncbi:MAG: hypothetical protein GY898_03920 [Proteobacteria bacterium]|nr:hypothetical protein [Pseudomonadota bacterium]
MTQLHSLLSAAALMLLLPACFQINLDLDDDLDPDLSVEPFVGCLVLSMTPAAVLFDETDVFDGLVGEEIGVSVSGLSDEFWGGESIRLNWDQPDVEIDGLPDDLADELEAAFTDGWSTVGVINLDGEPLFWGGQFFGPGGKGIIVQWTHEDPLNLDLDDEGNPIGAPFSTDCEATLTFVPDLDEPTVVSDAVVGPATVTVF